MQDIMQMTANVILMTANTLHAIWHYNLLTVSGNQINVSNILFALFLIVMGFRYSTNFTNFVKNRINAKIVSDKDAANAIEKLVLYAVLCVYVITILEIAHVPLQTFAFIGGALAIGIGLGAQSLIGNFIGSLIIMIERPLKIGDIVEIEGVVGAVASVGSRCVIINTFSNVEVLIPNSKLMQNSLINWTLSNSTIKQQAEISVIKTNDFDYKKFIQILKESVNAASVHEYCNDENINKTEIYLVTIEHNKLVFVMDFYCNVSRYQQPEYMKNILNMLLLDNLKEYEFKVTYPRIVNLKPLSDSGNETQVPV